MREGQDQKQEQSQQVVAEIHTHNHYYLIQSQDGSIEELSGLTNTDPNMVQAMLNTTLGSLTSSSSGCSYPPTSSSSSSPSSSMKYPYGDSELSSSVSLTTSAPVSQISTQTPVNHTTLPPVQIPGKIIISRL